MSNRTTSASRLDGARTRARVLGRRTPIMRNAASGTRDAGRRSGTKEEGWPADFRLSQTHRNRGRLGVWVERSRDSSLRYFNNLRGISAIRPTTVSADALTP